MADATRRVSVRLSLDDAARVKQELREVGETGQLSGVSAYGTKRAIRITEDFWLIVTPRRVMMSQKSSAPPMRVPAEKLVRDIRRATRKHHSAEDKIRIVWTCPVFMPLL